MSAGEGTRQETPEALADLAGADRRIARRLLLCFFLFYAVFDHGHFTGTDEVTVYESARSLWRNGDPTVPRSPCAYRGRAGQLYGCFAIGQSVLALPFYGAGQWAATALLPEWARALSGVRVGFAQWSGHSVEIFAVTLYAPLASGLLVALFFLFQRRLGVSLRSALLATGLLGACTYVAAMSVYFLRHTTEALTTLGALYFFLGFRKSGRIRSLLAGSLLASLTLLVRVPATVAAPALGAYLGFVLWERWRERPDPAWLRPAFVALAMPALAVAATHVAVNLWKWDHWIRSPMLDQTDQFTAPFLLGVAGLLISPGGSIFLYSPLLFLLPWTLRHFWRQHRAECATVIGLALSILALSASFYTWHGLWSAPGSRYMFVAVVALMLPLGSWLDHARGGLARTTLFLLAGVGLVAQLGLMAVSSPAVNRAMHYPRNDHRMLFLFQPDQSPLIGHLRLLLRGQWDIWLWWLWRGWPGFESRPETVLVILALWATCLAAALTLLWRAVRAHPGTRTARAVTTQDAREADRVT